MQRALSILTVAVVLSIAVPAASGQSVPVPSVNDLGISENDVRDEPNHPDDLNNLTDEDPFFSPKDDRLILDGFTEYTFGAVVGEDVSNVGNAIVHGGSTDDYEHRIYPGKTEYGAWWGYWSDTGGGGGFQETPADGTGFVGEANGAVDDADDCSENTWDEFVWRGQNPCADDGKGKDVPKADISDNMDQMFAFVQPGTHDIHINTHAFGCRCPTDAPLQNHSHAWYQPDFIYENPEGQVWRNANGFSRYHYDASTTITTQVVTSVNPEEIDKPEDGTEFDPYTGGGSAVHAHDVDVYTALHPIVEDAYRMTVWDPPQDHGDDEDEGNVLADVHPRGLKGFLVGPGDAAVDSGEQTVVDTSSGALESVEPARGVADDVVFGPYKHEPNTADDAYLDKDGNTLAAYDGHNTYGGLDGDYYHNPDADQDYLSYEDGEHFWADAKLGVNTRPVWAGAYIYGAYQHVTPEVPSTSNPVESTAEEDDDTQGPTVLYVHANVGTWYDKNGDTWVGDADGSSYDPDEGFTDTAFAATSGRNDGYDDGTDDDPNDYDSSEFRGTCSAAISTTLVPTEDTDGDGVDDWGATGVYVMSRFDDGNPYSDMAMDVAGDTTQPVGDQARSLHPIVSYAVPDDQDGRLSRHRTEGPIDMDGWFCSSTEFGSGDWDNGVAVLFPTGSLEISFEARTTAELTDEGRQGQSGATKGDDLAGATVTDVDQVEAILGTG